MDIPLIEQVKIQAQVLVPLVKALQGELGEERANAIVRKALGDLYRSYGEKWWRTRGERNLGEKVASAFEMFAAGDALEYEVVRTTELMFSSATLILTGSLLPTWPSGLRWREYSTFSTPDLLQWE